MPFELVQSEEFEEQLTQLANDPGLRKRYKAVAKCLRFLANDPRHQGLNTHKYSSLQGPDGEEVFEAYAAPPPTRRTVDLCFSADVETDGPIPGPYSMLSSGIKTLARNLQTSASRWTNGKRTSGQALSRRHPQLNCSRG